MVLLQPDLRPMSDTKKVNRCILHADGRFTPDPYRSRHSRGFVRIFAGVPDKALTSE